MGLAPLWDESSRAISAVVHLDTQERFEHDGRVVDEWQYYTKHKISPPTSLLQDTITVSQRLVLQTKSSSA